MLDRLSGAGREDDTRPELAAAALELRDALRRLDDEWVGGGSRLGAHEELARRIRSVIGRLGAREGALIEVAQRLVEMLEGAREGRIPLLPEPTGDLRRQASRLAGLLEDLVSGTGDGAPGGELAAPRSVRALDAHRRGVTPAATHRVPSSSLVSERALGGAGEGLGRSDGGVEGTERIHLVADITTGREPPSIAAWPSSDASAAAGDGVPIAEIHDSSGVTTRLVPHQQTVRVALARLDRIFDRIGELGLLRRRLQALAARAEREPGGAVGLDSGFHQELGRLGRDLETLRAELLEPRLVPLAPLFERLGRLARKHSREVGRDVRLDLSGGETRLDQPLVDELWEPLFQLVRSAIDDGIEPRPARRQAGKPAYGVLTLDAVTRDERVILTVADDGAGVDGPRLVRRAVARGLLAADRAATLGLGAMHDLVFLPGLGAGDAGDPASLAEVAEAVARLSGLLDLESTPGVGSRLRITLPRTLVSERALLVRSGSRRYALPVPSVVETLPEPVGGQRDDLVRAGRTIPLVRLGGAGATGGVALLLGLAHRRLVLTVDEVLGEEEVVARPEVAADGAEERGDPTRRSPGAPRSALVERGGGERVPLLDVAALLDGIDRPGDAR